MAITNGYCTLAELKGALRITDTVDDTLLETAINSASRAIDGACERTFYDEGTDTRLYLPADSFLTEIDDLQSLTSLKTSPDGETFSVTWTATDYQLEPLNGKAGGITTPFTRIRAVGDYVFPFWDFNNVNHYEATVEVTGTWGFASIPDVINQATIIYAMRQFKRYDSPLGIAGFGDIGAMRVSRIDPDIESMIMPFRKVSMA